MTDLARRGALTGVLAGLTGAALSFVTRNVEARGAEADKAASRATEPPSAPAGRLKQSVCHWPYHTVKLEELCPRLKRMGLVGIDLLYQDEWPIARDAGLTVSMGYASHRDNFIPIGFNDPANHKMLLNELETALPLAAKAGVPNVIAMFGNRDPARDDAAAIDACIEGLSKIKPLAEECGVTVCVELLNSRVNHPGYQGDHTAFGVAVMKGVNSPRVKLLYDIYHMQIMEGDLIRTITENIGWLGHFHTGGVPGRHELDDTQEVNWAGVMRAIAATKYKGYVAHEFLPAGDPLRSLQQAVELCDV